MAGGIENRVEEENVVVASFCERESDGGAGDGEEGDGEEIGDEREERVEKVDGLEENVGRLPEGEDRDEGRGEDEKEERKGDDRDDEVVAGFGEISLKSGVGTVDFERREEEAGALERGAEVICNGTWRVGCLGFLYKFEYILFTTVPREKQPLGTLAPKPIHNDAIFREA